MGAARNARLEIPELLKLSAVRDSSSAAHRGAAISAHQLPSPFGAKRREGGRCHSEVSAEPT
jgi:hypothetical protein